ncbi:MULTISPECIES: type II toxin-antitoxin system HicB family antitoxin [unclassified Micromonospora]|uniref:type II toxin-antitoxin system HicB family antitoxin n=1 Tax=unclassified Micromonospora TaxID=2617518 RepID=UPI001C227AA3|nr:MULTISPECIES: type II toxin-antitoxin system HicB family antitoxin [unclassified Micromonospora]MBU8858470.1 type II toxin-antitoxin system HicB family antitoxin [Micromonospora sp. WMMB482]MDM4784113.1 type II toxin-antitoxin system HicB family antitoxin [Micromonospora sp. b486]
MKYTAKCVRSGDWWAITVPEIKGVFSQARRLNQVEAMAREAIALLLDVDPQSFDVDVRPDLPQEVTRARKARSALRKAEETAEEATVTAARALLEKGYTVRDTGALLGLSPQRVSQLAPKKARADHVGKTNEKAGTEGGSGFKRQSAA